MKKIMFNDKYGLTAAVLLGRKTMTRRIIVPPKKFKGNDDIMLEYHQRLTGKHFYDCVVCDADGYELGQMPLPYEVGEVVAIAQTYKEAGWQPTERLRGGMEFQHTAGWTNKMFVLPILMPWKIIIGDIWFERLQDISDEDCLREGVEKWLDSYIVPGIMENRGKNNVCYDTPREAFAALIDKVSGKGTWAKNPMVAVYEFELTK